MLNILEHIYAFIGYVLLLPVNISFVHLLIVFILVLNHFQFFIYYGY